MKPYQFDNFYYAVYNTESVKPFNFCGTINITLTLEGGEKVTGQYDIGEWYNSIPEADQAYWGDLFKALKELGDSQYAYRITEVQ